MKLRFFLSLVVLCVALCLAGTVLAAGGGLDLSKALVVGNGPKMVIEFTDPDCPFCRKAAAYFNNRRDVTLYIFFTPLAMHPHARQKAQYILSGSDKSRLYHEVMAGAVDKTPVHVLTSTPAGVKLLDEQQAIARKNGVDATPTFMIMGRIVEGFDQHKIEELLGK